MTKAMRNENDREPETKSVFASFVGRPNVGKSSLLNRLVGEKIAIVTPKPQTTRSRITGVVTMGAVQYVFFDTPGFHKAKNKLSDHMLTTISDTLAESELCVFLTDSTPGITSEEKDLLESCKARHLHMILAINKIDLLEDKNQLLDKITFFCGLADFAAVVPMSVKENDGVDLLLEELAKFAQSGPHFFEDDALTDQPEKVILAELVREQILLQLAEEVPHGVGVYVEQMHDRTDRQLVDIHAVIVCEKDSHKGIIIGKQGSMLKKIGTAARLSMAAFLDCPVNLQLFVKVKEDWRNRENVIRQLGLQ